MARHRARNSRRSRGLRASVTNRIGRNLPLPLHLPQFPAGGGSGRGRVRPPSFTAPTGGAAGWTTLRPIYGVVGADTVPEAPRNLAGGAASLRAGTTGLSAKSEPVPEGRRNYACVGQFQRPCRGGFASLQESGGFSLADSLHHRLISTAPPARSTKPEV